MAKVKMIIGGVFTLLTSSLFMTCLSKCTTLTSSGYKHRYIMECRYCKGWGKVTCLNCYGERLKMLECENCQYGLKPKLTRSFTCPHCKGTGKKSE